MYRYWYWVLVSLEANIIGYLILGAFPGIVLTLGPDAKVVTEELWNISVFVFVLTECGKNLAIVHYRFDQAQRKVAV